MKNVIFIEVSNVQIKKKNHIINAAAETPLVLLARYCASVLPFYFSSMFSKLLHSTVNGIMYDASDFQGS